ncbi:hypothetical protein V9T40_010295 [Parthenolecanium corni]|uniref:JmjC domain-containing protein n=1 Tax=Parthenolecanium corni TaxID=536013 RepID=A0AAN9T8I8_9HEMI
MNRERYKPWMVFCEGHLRADKRNIGGSSKKMHNPRKFSLQNKTNSSDVKFETAVVDVSTKQKQETPCKVQDDDMSIEMLQDQSLLGKLPENLKLNKCYVVDMNAGDVLLIPPKWWHYVENITLAASINMWIPVKDDDISRLDEALVRFLISSLTNNAPDNMKNFILNPNELDLKGGSINLQIIEFCRKTIEGASEKISVETKNDLYDSTSHKHKYKIIRPISIFEFKKILPNCSNCQYEITSEELFLEDHVDTLTTIINAFCHPDIIGQIREKFLH